MSWLSQAGAVIAAVVVLFVPGALAAGVVRLRGFAVLAAAGPLSLAGLTAASLIGVLVPFRWGVAGWAITAGALVLTAFGVRFAVERYGGHQAMSVSLPSRRGREVAAFLIVAACAVIGAWRMSAAIGRPEDISQTFDNLYHLNAVRQVMNDGMIAPTRQLLPGFYPDLWHVVTATVAELSGAGVAVSVNAVGIVLGAVVWPIGCIWLVRTIVGPSVVAAATAGVLSIGVTAFPLLMLDFGVLYPNVLSISLLPTAIAAVVTVSGVGRGERPPGLLRWVLLVALVPTLALAHPSTLMAFMLPAFWLGLSGHLRWRRQSAMRNAPSAGRTRGTAVLLAVLASSVVLFVVARPSTELAFWPPSASLSEALTQLVSTGLVWRPPAWTVSVLVLLGVLTVLISKRWRGQWWLIASLAMLAFVYVVCLSFPMSWFRYGITGTWYQDIYRIAALLPTFLVPLGALGILGITTSAALLLRDRARTAAAISVGVGLIFVASTLVLTQTGAALAEETANTAAVYRQSPSSPLLTDDERALIERLPEHVSIDDVIVGSPWTGTSLSYALVDRRALVPHIFQELSPDMRLIVDHLNRAAEDPRVCAALARTHTRWVLDFGTQEIHDGDHAYPGLKDLGASAVRLVDRQGDARLYRIVACG
jgi:hypothetical protein